MWNFKMSQLPYFLSVKQKVNQTETDRLKSKPVFNLKPFSGFSSRWSRNIVEVFKNMGKTDHDQHQIDKRIFKPKIIIVQSHFQR